MISDLAGEDEEGSLGFFLQEGEGMGKPLGIEGRWG
jgi:hypothetical protein